MKKTQMIILAGGTGERFGGNLPKQFTKLAGKTIIEHTIEKIENCDLIDSILIVVNPNFYDYLQKILDKNSYKKVKKVIAGGNSRQESSYAGILACDSDTESVLFHDAIRPFVSNRILTDVIMALDTHKAVDVAIPCADTIVKVNDGNVIDSIPERKYLLRGQTPQGFDLDLIKKAYERYLQDDNLNVTDDCGIICAYQMADIFVVKGEEQNIKITYQEDAYLADKLFQIHSVKLMEETKEDSILHNIKGKVGVIFGHTSGIGKDIYDLVQASGEIVYGFSRNNGVDICDYQAVEKALSKVYDKEGRIDYVINLAAILSISSLEETDQESIELLTTTNFVGSVHVTKLALPYLKKSRGHILLFTSSSYTRGRANYSIYSATKAAVVNFAQAISEEVFEDGVCINVINPERTNTPMRRKNFGVEPEGSLLDSKKVALETVKALGLSITGQVIDVRR